MVPWVRKSEQVLVCEGIEDTPMYVHYGYVHARCMTVLIYKLKDCSTVSAQL